MSKPKRIVYKTSEAERSEYARKLAEESQPQLRSQGRRVKQELAAERVRLEETCRMLKAERERQGKSLAEVESLTGISRGAISRLENLIDPNPTIATLIRLANALGKQLLIGLEPQSNRS